MLILAFVLMTLIGVARFLLDISTTAAKTAMEMLMMIVAWATLIICKLLPLDEQEDWAEYSANLTLWAKARSKMVLVEDDEENAASDTSSKPEEPQETTSAYDWALKIMGLEDQADLTLPKLKQRYRQMMSVVHPDKQFPNHVFAQQINDSVETIKRHHGWQ